jgi:tetratricopeptide (TPR) repeat protein
MMATSIFNDKSVIAAIIGAFIAGVFGLGYLFLGPIIRKWIEGPGKPGETAKTHTAGPESQQLAVGPGAQIGQLTIQYGSSAEEIAEKLAQKVVPPPTKEEVRQELSELQKELTVATEEAEKEYNEALDLLNKGDVSEAISFLRRALGRVNTPAFHFALSNAYYEVRNYPLAIEHVEQALGAYEKMGKVEKIAALKNNLAILYSDTQRLGEAEGAYNEALEIRRRLAEKNPEAYEPYVATTLNNLAILYSDTQRLGEAEGAYNEALEIRRRLAEKNPEAYEPYVANILNNLAILYSDTQRLGEAEGAYGEALELYRRLAEKHPEAYEPDVAMTLNNLGNLYSDTQRLGDAEGAYGEALELYRRLAEKHPYDPKQPGQPLQRYPAARRCRRGLREGPGNQTPPGRETPRGL